MGSDLTAVVTMTSTSETIGNGPVDVEHFEPSTEWVNWGDVNPEPHGGAFVQWQPEQQKWTVVSTHPYFEDEQVVEQFDVYPDDIWTDPSDPETEFTHTGQLLADSLARTVEPMTYEFLEDPGLLVSLFQGYLDTRRTDFIEVSEYDDYNELIARYGVDEYETQ
jgi:hypothetical protein